MFSVCLGHGTSVTQTFDDVSSVINQHVAGRATVQHVAARATASQLAPRHKRRTKFRRRLKRDKSTCRKSHNWTTGYQTRFGGHCILHTIHRRNLWYTS